MEEYTSKRAPERLGLGVSGRGSNLSFRDPNHEDRRLRYGSQLGCSTRINSMKGSQLTNQEKYKYPKSYFRSTSSKAIAESSSASFATSSEFEWSHQERQHQPSLHEALTAESSSRLGDKELRCYNRQELIEDSDYRSRLGDEGLRCCNRQVLIEDSDSRSRLGDEGLRCCNRQVLIEDPESSSREGEIGDSEFGSVTSGMQSVRPHSHLEFANLQGSTTNSTEELSRCNAPLTSRTHRQTTRRLGYGKQDTPGSSLRHSSVSRTTFHIAKPISQGSSSGTPRYGLKSLGCTSISDVLSSGCSSSEVSHNRRVDEVRKRPSDGESSSAWRTMSGYSNGRYYGASHRNLSGLPLECPIAQPNSRRGRSQPSIRDGAVSVRTRRPPAGESIIRLSEQEDDNVFSASESVPISRLPPTQFSLPDAASGGSSRSFTREMPPASRNSFRRSGATGRSARTGSSSHPEDGSTQIFRSPLGDRGSHRRGNMTGIAEVLLLLERIEQEELSYEQLLVLETNLFLGELNFRDQHRDMRLDIDNMSYEELLALEEKMGNVSTSLSEESLTKCLKRSIYSAASACPRITCHGDDDLKCSVCQEEYAVGDAVGELACKHRFHVTCIHQWLRQKNWCPICKTCACPSLLKNP